MFFTFLSISHHSILTCHFLAYVFGLNYSNLPHFHIFPNLVFFILARNKFSSRVVFTSKRMLPVARKDVLATTLKSSVVYEYSCHCDSRYVGRTSQRLQDRIKQHAPKWLQQQAKRPTRSQPGRSCKLKRNNPDCDSAIGQHLLNNEQCAANYNDKRFKILAVARNSFHLCLLEATFIKTKHPVLCKQKEFVYTLKLFK